MVAHVIRRHILGKRKYKWPSKRRLILNVTFEIFMILNVEVRHCRLLGSKLFNSIESYVVSCSRNTQVTFEENQD